MYLLAGWADGTGGMDLDFERQKGSRGYLLPFQPET